MDDRDALATFEATVATQGYEWIETKDGPVLTARVHRGRGDPPRQYRPLSKPYAALFRDFSQLAITPAAILEFANRYGLLGHPVTVPFTPEGVLAYTDVPNGELFDADLLSKKTAREFKRFGKPSPYSWVGHIRAMQGVVQGAQRHLAGDNLWDAGVLSLTPTRVRVVPTNPNAPRKPVDPRSERTDRTMQAIYIATQLTKVVRTVIAPRVKWIPPSSRPAGPGRFRLEFAPDSLIGCLWLQATQALTQQKEYRTCAGPRCGRLIEVSLDATMGARADVQFCSDACKSRDYRHRKAEARSLAAKGQSPATIAKALHSDTATVRRWLDQGVDQ